MPSNVAVSMTITFEFNVQQMAWGGLAESKCSWKMRGDGNWQIQSTASSQLNWLVAQGHGASQERCSTSYRSDILFFVLGQFQDFSFGIL